jgi:tripartite-type tricarboxylate transporter receptor subunit TctC
MQITVDYNFDQIILAIKQMPPNQLIKVKKVVEKSLETEQVHKNSELKKLVLDGPLMSDEQYENYLENRKKMNQWRNL